MLDMQLDVVRPDPDSEPFLEEQRLQVFILPIRLQLDKDLLEFLKASVDHHTIFLPDTDLLLSPILSLYSFHIHSIFS